MTAVVTDETIKSLLRGPSGKPLEGLRETGDSWSVGYSVRIQKRRPTYSDGFGHDLQPSSHFYRRRFAVTDPDVQGTAVIFQLVPPETTSWPMMEYFAGWVPTDREDEADHWIRFLNAEIRDRLVTAGIEPVLPGPPNGELTVAAWSHNGQALTLVSDYREERGARPDAPSILTAMGKGGRAPELRIAMAQYLRAAPRIVVTMGFSVDLLDPSQYAGSASIRADGVFAWHDTLAHYVEHDDVVLPASFETHLRARVAAMPTTEPAAPASTAPRRLAFIGNFRELGFFRRVDGQAPPSLATSRGAGRSETTRASVASYLRAGWELGGAKERTLDVFHTATLAGDSGLLTDGVYAWPQFLAYYVDRYDVSLPPAFEEHMRKRGWRPPMSVKTEGLQRP